MAESSQKSWKTLCGKGEIVSNLQAILPFLNSVFKRRVSQGRQKVSLCGNGLNAISKHYRENYISFAFALTHFIRNSFYYM